MSARQLRIIGWSLCALPFVVLMALVTVEEGWLPLIVTGVAILVAATFLTGIVVLDQASQRRYYKRGDTDAPDRSRPHLIGWEGSSGEIAEYERDILRRSAARYKEKHAMPTSDPHGELAAAGRAAREVLSMAYTAFRHSEEDSFHPEPSEDEVYESVAQAVLDALGIRLDGWEWGTRWRDGISGVVSTYDSEADARRAYAELQEAGYPDVGLGRRRKVTTELEDAE